MPGVVDRGRRQDVLDPLGEIDRSRRRPPAGRAARRSPGWCWCRRPAGLLRSPPARRGRLRRWPPGRAARRSPSRSGGNRRNAARADRRSGARFPACGRSPPAGRRPAPAGPGSAVGPSDQACRRSSAAIPLSSSLRHLPESSSAARIAAAISMPVTRARARQPGTALTSSTTSWPAVEVGDQVDARHLGSDRRGPRPGPAARPRDRARHGSARPPSDTLVRQSSPVSVPPHHADDLATQHEDAVVVPRMPDEPLKVQDRAQAFERVQGPPGQLHVADPDQSTPLGAKQRLDHDVASERIEGRQPFGRPVSRPGRRHRQARSRERAPASGTCRRPLPRPAAGSDTGTPAAATRCKASIRKTTCSRLPGGIIRTSTPSAAVRSSSPAVTRARAPAAADDRRDRGKRHRSQRHVDPPGRTQQVFNMPAKTGNQGNQRFIVIFRFRIFGFSVADQPAKRTRQHFGIRCARRHESCRYRRFERRPRPG